MFVRRIGVSLSLLGAVVLVALVGWTGAEAASPARDVQGAIQQTMPMTGTVPMDHAMPAQTDEHANHEMPASAAHETPQLRPAGQGGMGAMMANMAEMQKMMARMQRMMAGDMMAGSMPMSGTMPMAGMMGGDMGEMMDMMAEMQEMMAEMQGMMAGEMMSGGMPMGGQMQSQQMPSQQQGGMMGGQMQGGMGMMGQMPMMGTVIIVAPMPMGGMMQQGGMGMMGQMPMMQGMMSGGMMGGDMMSGGMGMGGMMGQGGAPGATDAAAPAAGGGTEQSGKLGAIDVKVTPPDLSNVQGDTIDFTVDLNASGVDLGLDLAALATLKIGDHAMPATAWTVKFDHGHHVNGILSFPAHMSGPVASATLTITDPAGGAALALTWPAAK